MGRKADTGGTTKADAQAAPDQAPAAASAAATAAAKGSQQPPLATPRTLEPAGTGSMGASTHTTTSGSDTGSGGTNTTSDTPTNASAMPQPQTQPQTQPAAATTIAGGPPARQAGAAAPETASGTASSLVDTIRQEQANQIAQARHKGSQAQAQDKKAGIPQGSADAARAYCKEDGMFIDEEELLRHSTFPIPPERLCEMAKDALRKGVQNCTNLADDFQFSAPFIGPLTREGFASVMGTLDLDTVFPDMSPRVYHVRADPLQPNRVWFTTRPIGTNKGFLTAKLPVPQPPTNKVVELPPQTSSLSFNEQGEIIDFTMGYVMDRRLGNSGGLGGAFGFLWALGVPFPYPEGKPWSASLQQRLFNSGSPILQRAMFVLDRISTALLPSSMTAAHSRSMP